MEAFNATLSAMVNQYGDAGRLQAIKVISSALLEAGQTDPSAPQTPKRNSRSQLQSPAASTPPSTERRWTKSGDLMSRLVLTPHRRKNESAASKNKDVGVSEEGLTTHHSRGATIDVEEVKDEQN